MRQKVTQPNLHIKATLVRKIICYPFDGLFARFLRRGYNQQLCTWMSSLLLFLKLQSLFPDLRFREQKIEFLFWTEAKLTLSNECQFLAQNSVAQSQTTGKRLPG